MRYWIVLILFLAGLNAEAQSRNIVFFRSNLNEVLTRAKRENKHIFIDTYASWCVPCKRMEKVFRDPKVAQYYNNNFINYRVNMEGGPEAEFMKSEYGVVFLPTMIILNPQGQVEFKHDQEMTPDEMLQAARQAINPKSYFASSEAHGSSKIVKQSGLNGNQEVVMTTTTDPHDDTYILRDEAYFRKSLQNGSHKKAAVDYLNTQKEWNTHENMQFILDFTEEVNTKMFDHIMKYRRLFDQEFGKREVENVLNTVIFNRLNNGFPRPSLNEAERLYKKIKVEDAYAFANNYFINRLLRDGEHRRMMYATREYLSRRPGDVNIAFTISQYIYTNWDKFERSDQDYGRKLSEDLFYHEQSSVEYAALRMKYLMLEHRCKSAAQVVDIFLKKSDYLQSDDNRLRGLLATCK